MVRLIVVILCGVMLALAMIVILLVAGLRRRSPAVRRAVRRFNRVVVNPRVLRRAGTPGAYASVIEHAGRRTGRPYRTPVVAERTDDGFVIALPYGTAANWVRNVMASGSATIVHEGETYPVDQPEILPLALMAAHFPAKDRRSLDRFRVDRCVRVRRADRAEPEREAAGASRAVLEG